MRAAVIDRQIRSSSNDMGSLVSRGLGKMFALPRGAVQCVAR